MSVDRLPPVPLLVVLLAVAGLAMLVPAGFALAAEDRALAALFARTAMVVLTAAAVLAAATAGYRPAKPVQSQVLSLVGAYVLLPPILAVPVAEALPGLGFRAAWFEMVSSFTTTGASILPAGAATPAPVHLWNALVGWLGGFFVLLAATALLAPLNLGGMEVANPRPVGRPALAASPIHGGTEPGQRLWLNLRLMAPVYAGLTLALWVGLMVAGDPGFVALAHAMGILSTSGISPEGGIGAMPSGRLGEALMLAFLLAAVTRRSLPGATPGLRARPLWRDRELWLAAVLVVGLAVLLTLRHGLAAAQTGDATGLGTALAGFWAALFTLGSFLTTTGYVAGGWAAALDWAGLGAPVLLLAGMVMVGGGVATTAGGIKLLRVLSLYRHGRHEMERLLQPSLVAGGGEEARHLRSDGAHLAWVAFMLLLLSLAVTVAALALAGIAFEPALILGIAALSTAGPLVSVAGPAAVPVADLDHGARAILGAAMVLGRLELLAIVALLVPESWRR